MTQTTNTQTSQPDEAERYLFGEQVRAAVSVATSYRLMLNGVITVERFMNEAEQITMTVFDNNMTGVVVSMAELVVRLAEMYADAAEICPHDVVAEVGHRIMAMEDATRSDTTGETFNA
jgi:hypothetical protein